MKDNGKEIWCTSCTHCTIDYGCAHCDCGNNILMNRYSFSAATVCDVYESMVNKNLGLVPINKALLFMLSGEVEFCLLSTATNVKLHYKLKRVSVCGNDNSTYFNKSKDGHYNYLVYAKSGNGRLKNYGTIYFDKSESQFKFSRLKSISKNEVGSKLVGLLYVMNHLISEDYTMLLQVYHMGTCEICKKRLVTLEDCLKGTHKKCRK